MKEDNYIDQGVKEMLDILTEHSRNERRQQQLSAMMDRAVAIKKKRLWLWAVTVAVLLSVVVALGLLFVKGKPKAMSLSMNEPNTEMPQAVEEPMAVLAENAFVVNEEPIVETQNEVKPQTCTTKSAVSALLATEAKRQPSSGGMVPKETTYSTEIIESENTIILAEPIENKHDETFENQIVEPVSCEQNHAATSQNADSVAPTNKLENPYRPKHKFTLRVGGEIDPYDWSSLPFPPIKSHFALGFTVDYHFTENFSMGLGAEWFGVSTYNCFYSSYQKRLHAIPVYVDLKLNFLGKKNYSPFLEARLGYSIPLNKVTEYYPMNDAGVYVDYILSGPYLSFGLGCSMKHSNLSAGVVYSHASQPGKLKESFGFVFENYLIWGTNFYIRYDYTFAPFSDEGKRRLRQIKNGKLNEFNGDGFQLQLNVAGGLKPWCYSVGAALEYKFPKHFCVGVGADFRGVNFTTREWGSVGYFENPSEGQMLSVPVYGSLKVHFWENKPFSPFVEYRMGYAFALNSLTATHWESEFQETVCYEKWFQGKYAYLGIGVTHNHSSLSLGILGQDGKCKETIGGHPSTRNGCYTGGYPFELRYSYRIGSSAKR